MCFTSLFIICAMFLAFCNEGRATEVTYMAAVLEYEAYWDEDYNGTEVVIQNALNVANYSALAKEFDVDIIIAPEYGIHSLENNYSNYLPYTQYVPEKSYAVIPCYEPFPENNEAIQILSCAAIENSMYIVADVAELRPCNETTISEGPTWGGYTVEENCTSFNHDGYLFHNTQVVFDRSGTVIARYRKQHLYLEPEFTPGTFDNSLAIFETDFGVTFTLQICFDILFATPGYYNVKYQGIKDVAMSTAWVDIMPFGLADDAQDSWSRALKTNLLVSGYHWPENTKMGSGIYNMYDGQEANYIYYKDSGNYMVYGPVTTILTVPISSPPKSSFKSGIAELPKGNLVTISEEEEEDRTHNFVYTDLTHFGSILLNNTGGLEVNTNVCSNDTELCCDLNYNYEGELYYRLFAESGLINVGNGDNDLYLGAQMCMITWCLDDENVTSCGIGNETLPQPDEFGPFDMTAKFITKEVFPIGTRKNLTLVRHEDLLFDDGYDTFGISSPLVEDPFTLALFGRWITNDP